MDEPLDLTSDFASLEKDMSAIDVVLCELEAVAKRVVNMSLCCKVHDGVNGLREEDVVDKVSSGNVSLDELEVLG